MAQVRLKFVTQDETIRVTEAPIAVPTKLGRSGLSEVINHLRGAADAADSYDFIIESALLRTTLEKFLKAREVSTVRGLLSRGSLDF
jgi:hypothetical protein